MKLVVVTALAIVVGCGRSGFDVQDAGSDSATIGDDATDASPDGLLSTCPTFCDDFNDGDTSPWNTQTGGTGTAVVTNGRLVVTLSATSDTYFLQTQLPAPTTSVSISMKIGWTVSDAGTDCELDLVALNWNMGSCAVPYGFYLVRDGTGPFNVQETNGNAGCNGNRNNPLQNLDNTGLHDVKLTLLLGAANVARVQLDVDGANVLDRATLQPVPSSTLELKVGGVAIRNVASPWTITYDDIVVDVQ